MAKNKNSVYNANRCLTLSDKSGKFINSNGVMQDDKFVPITLSLRQSKQFNNLSKALREFFLTCALETNNKQLMNKGFEKDCFYFNRKKAASLGYKNPNQTTGYLKKLIDAGFIEIVEDNHHRFKKNVYKLSCNWKDLNWKPPPNEK